MAMRQHITMDDVVGSKVLIKLHREAYEALEIQGVDSEKFVAHVVGIDGFGMWVENPNYKSIPVYDDNGDYIPPEDREEVTHRAVFLLSWPTIQTIVQFPERKAYHAGVDESEIGFKAMMLNKENKDG